MVRITIAFLYFVSSAMLLVGAWRTLLTSAYSRGRLKVLGASLLVVGCATAMTVFRRNVFDLAAWVYLLASIGFIAAAGCFVVALKRRWRES